MEKCIDLEQEMAGQRQSYDKRIEELSEQLKEVTAANKDAVRHSEFDSIVQQFGRQFIKRLWVER